MVSLKDRIILSIIHEVDARNSTVSYLEIEMEAMRLELIRLIMVRMSAEVLG